ncbi:MAG: LPXTG cell wall anchor domain-containing protein [Lachnospiraceae bacterium]|nr:LPXTG cell wall anchor domain-containing protein [Lachnospiraceae bacterium]
MPECVLARGFRHSAIEGSGSNWEKGSSSGDKFVFKRNVNDYKTFSQFTGISVDQIKVDVSNYTAEAGSVIIVLKPEYLETLSVGKHTLTAMFTDAEDVTVEFEVTAKGKSTTPETTVTPPTDNNANNNADNTNTGKKSVKTGDNMNVGMVVMIMIDTALAGIYLTLRKRRNK